jgi:hypothetical protein
VMEAWQVMVESAVSPVWERVVVNYLVTEAAIGVELFRRFNRQDSREASLERQR